ncbi:MAG TPA: biotin/lipoyl-containing protein [Ktedonobacterales bacterium]|nr:biotin/lipoyl-containing protein [Ktedonobacterales bacterium]
MRYVATIGGRKHVVEIEENGHIRRVVVDGRELAVDWRLVGAPGEPAVAEERARAAHYSLLIGNQSYDAFARPVPTEESTERAIEVHIHGYPYVVEVRDERTEALAQLSGGAHAAGDAAIRAPMPGLVVNVLAELGTEVQRGQTVVVLEAMKMENDLQSPRAGVVKDVRAAKGQTVGQGEVLAVIGDPAGAAPAEDEEE